MDFILNEATEDGHSVRTIVKFKKTLKNFEGSENQLFDAVIYGIMHTGAMAN